MLKDPSSASIDRTRRLVLLAVWAFVLLGLPLWWKTTRVYRAQLPFNEIEQWTSWKTCSPKFSVKANIHLPPDLSFDDQDLEQIKTRFLNVLGSSSQDSVGDLNLVLEAHSWEGAVEQEVKKLPNKQGSYDFFVQSSATTEAIIHTNRVGVLKIKDWDNEHIIDAMVQLLSLLFGPEHEAIRKLFTTSDTLYRDRDELRAMKYAPGYQLTLSLFSGDADNHVRDWEIQAAIKDQVEPFVRSIADVSDFVIESQIQHYATLTTAPALDVSRREYYLTPETLPNFINTAEWSLASTVSTYPSLNFILYIPSPKDQPLVIRDALGQNLPSNAFLIPRWGGIAILNREVDSKSSSATTISKTELEPIVGTMLSQLRELLGFPDLAHPKNPRLSPTFPVSFHQTNRKSRKPTMWELDYVMRRRIAENIVDSSSTLASLARLVENTPNMVVLDHIQDEVTSALEDLVAACQQLQLLDQGYQQALTKSKEALVRSEAAFFDPTMVSMLYFPDEHKYAIYMPLFVPISVPLIMALLREIKKMKQERGEEKKKQKAE
ncbi:hypothetical protein BGW42_008168 [Actinomortierella wolfii]|nr:hypothetical protein BGW42_008168 [Actinomortierella wolfii]